MTEKYNIGPILESLGAQLPAYQRQGWQKMSCPFHEDRTPSASVNFFLNRFNCHSCGASGDGIDLIQEQSGLSFKDAEQEAARLSEPSDQGVRRRTRPGRMLFGE